MLSLAVVLTVLIGNREFGNRQQAFSSSGGSSLGQVHAFPATVTISPSSLSRLITSRTSSSATTSPAEVTRLPGWARRTSTFSSHPGRTKLFSSSNNNIQSDEAAADEALLRAGGGRKTTLTLVAGQTLLVGAAALAALIAGTPNLGLGSNFAWSWAAVKDGALLTLPLGILACSLDLIDDKVPALQDVTKATQQSVLAIMGGTFKPVTAVLTAVALGLAAGVGEEWLFRGVVQLELADRVGAATGVALSSLVFGLLHAVTPLYAIFAGLASIYFGAIYLYTDNLAVAMACHTLYDIGALLFAHWTVCQLSRDEIRALARWEGPRRSKTMKPDVL